MDTPKKSIFKSKVFWFNGLTIIVTVAGFFGYAPNPELAQGVSEKLLIIAPVVNIVLRAFTKKPVTI